MAGHGGGGGAEHPRADRGGDAGGVRAGEGESRAELSGRDGEGGAVRGGEGGVAVGEEDGESCGGEGGEE